MKTIVRSKFFVVIGVVGAMACGRALESEQRAPVCVSEAALRPDTPDAGLVPPVFDAQESVELYGPPDASVVVHFSRTGRNQVSSTDNDDSGVPDFVEDVSRVYDEVSATYHGAWGFRVPPSDALVPDDNGGDGRFDTYLLDFALRADGAFRRECLSDDATVCPGYLTQENDFAQYGYPSPGIGTRIVSSHEYFHAVQSGYPATHNTVLSEGTAVWATERFDPSLEDLEHFSGGYLATPERPLDQEPSGPVDPFAYGAGLFFECLTQQHDGEAVRTLFESLKENPNWLSALQTVLDTDAGPSLRTVLRSCFEFNLYTGNRARAGYGHRRAEQLGQTPVNLATNTLSVPRTPMFPTSTRYWRVENLPSDSVLWWSPFPGAPDGGAAWLEVRAAADVPGTPSFITASPDTVTALGGGSFFVLVSHVTPQVSSFPITLCVGSPDSVEKCRTRDAGVIDGGVDETPSPAPCGCTGTPLAPIVLMALFLLCRKRSGALVMALLSVSAFAQTPQETEPDAGEMLPDAGIEMAIDAGSTEAPFSEHNSADRVTVVTATRLPTQLKDSPVRIEVLTRRQIRESGARDAAEALQARPGVETFQNVGNVGLRMQGLGPEYNVILIDGQRSAGRVNGGIDLSRISVENIEQVEIVKGPSSVMWGSDALAGTVNIITRQPQKSLGGDATVTYGALNQTDVRAGGEASSERWGVSVNGGYRHRDAYDYDKTTPSTSGSSIDQAQGSLHASYGKADPTRPSADVRLDFTRRSQVGVDSNATGAVLDRRSRDNIFEGRVGSRLPLGKGGLNLGVGGTVYDRRFIIDQRNGEALDTVQDTTDSNVQFDTQFDQKLGQTHLGLAGGQVLFERLSTPRLNAAYGDRIRGALFIQDTWAPVTQLSAIGGLRIDWDSGFGTALTPRLAARYAPFPELTMRASTGLGFRAPSFQELMLNFENPSVGYVVLGNPKLRPERSFGSSVGAEWTPSKRWLISLDLFWNQLWDMIGYAISTETEVLRYQYTNVTRAHTRGFEASVGWNPLESLMFLAGYTLTDARNLTEGIPLEGQSPHRWFGQARFRYRPWGLTAQVRTSVTGNRPFSDGDTTKWTPPFALLDARVAKTLGSHFEIFVAGNNLIGSGNVADLPISPRTVFGGVSVHD